MAEEEASSPEEPKEEPKAEETAPKEEEKPASDANEGASSGGFADIAKTAGQDALNVAKVLAVNPLAGIGETYKSFDKQRALQAGIAFAVISYVASVLGIILLTEFSIKMLVFAVAPLVGMFVANLLVGKIFKSEGSLESAVFIAGTSLLPVSLFALIMGLLKTSRYEIIFVLLAFVLSYTMLILHGGCIKIHKISEKALTIAVPILIIVTGLVSYIAFKALY